MILWGSYKSTKKHLGCQLRVPNNPTLAAKVSADTNFCTVVTAFLPTRWWLMFSKQIHNWHKIWMLRKLFWPMEKHRCQSKFSILCEWLDIEILLIALLEVVGNRPESCRLHSWQMANVTEFQTDASASLLAPGRRIKQLLQWKRMPWDYSQPPLQTTTIVCIWKHQTNL